MLEQAKTANDVTSAQVCVRLVCLSQSHALFMNGEDSMWWCREASTPQEGGGSAQARLPAGGHQDGNHHPHPLRYHQGGSAAVGR